MKNLKCKKAWTEYYNKNIDFMWNESNPWTALNQGADCCKDKHPTFFGQIVESPQWKAWYDEQMRRFSDKNNKLPVFDIDESIGVGAIGERHLQEFFKFIINIYSHR